MNKNLFTFYCHPRNNPEHECKSVQLKKRDNVDWDSYDHRTQSVQVMLDRAGREALPVRFFQEKSTCAKHCAELPNLRAKALEIPLTHHLIGQMLTSAPVSPEWTGVSRSKVKLTQRQLESKRPTIATIIQNRLMCGHFFGQKPRFAPQPLQEIRHQCLKNYEEWIARMYETATEAREEERVTSSNSDSDSDSYYVPRYRSVTDLILFKDHKPFVVISRQPTIPRTRNEFRLWDQKHTKVTERDVHQMSLLPQTLGRLQNGEMIFFE